MTRKKEIDKEKVLDAAESLILESGGRLFTLDAVAERAGISKGGLVYTFSSKDGLIHAVLEREVARFQEAVRQRLPAAPVGPIELVLAHIEEALAEEDVSTQMAAFLITALVHAPGMLEPVRSLYRSLLDPLRSVSGEYVAVRHALLAVEGAFFAPWVWPGRYLCRRDKISITLCPYPGFVSLSGIHRQGLARFLINPGADRPMDGTT
ncbi:TetR family transcriptional regulator [Klebsiella variicola]|nr:TetR family transcriptional regulator [Klebsiella variicola]